MTDARGAMTPSGAGPAQQAAVPTNTPGEAQSPRPPFRVRFLHGLLLLLTAAGVLVSLVVVLQPRSGGIALPTSLPGLAPAPSVGRAAPDFALQLLDGSRMTLSGLRGKPVILNFWATWCPPCRTEMPDLQAVWQEHQSEGVVIVGVDLGEDPATVQSYVSRVGVTYPIALDIDQRVGETYGTGSLPTTYFIDRNGTVRDRYTGGMNKRVMVSKLGSILS